MTRILFLKQELTPKGGLEKYAKRLVEAFSSRDCEVRVATATPGITSFGGAPTTPLQIGSFFGFQRLKKWDAATKAWVQKQPHDLVFTLDRIGSATHIRAGNGVHASYLQRRREGILRSLSFKMNPLHRTLLRLERESFLSPNLRKIIVNSHMVKEEIESHYGVSPSKIIVHHNGVEYEEMAEGFAKWQEIRCEVESELKLKSGIFTFLFAGHSYKRKGLEDLLRGLSLLPEGRLLVVGKEKNLSRYHALVKNLRLTDRVHFLGQRSDMRRLYASADALAVPSLYDPFANVTLEAQAMGLFVVSSPFNGGKEILDETTGCTIENLFSPQSVAASLQTALALPKTEARAASIRAKAAPFDFSKQLSHLVDSCIL